MPREISSMFESYHNVSIKSATSEISEPFLHDVSPPLSPATSQHSVSTLSPCHSVCLSSESLEPLQEVTYASKQQVHNLLKTQSVFSCRKLISHLFNHAYNIIATNSLTDVGVKRILCLELLKGQF